MEKRNFANRSARLEAYSTNLIKKMKSIDPVQHSFAYGLDFLREQVADVADADMVAQPKGILNHPAWVVGHLTFVCQMLGGAIGLAPWLPDDWASRFGPGSQPVADLRVYESKVKALTMLHEAEVRFTRAIDQLDESSLDKPFPVESYLEVFPTIRHSLTQVLVGHTAFHIGQLSIWRTSMGLPPLRRSFQ